MANNSSFSAIFPNLKVAHRRDKRPGEKRERKVDKRESEEG